VKDLISENILFNPPANKFFTFLILSVMMFSLIQSSSIIDRLSKALE
jgi:hypothetical protein